MGMHGDRQAREDRIRARVWEVLSVLLLGGMAFDLWRRRVSPPGSATE